MTTNTLNREVHLPHIRALAERLITDIRHRGLGVGDRYLTTEEASRMLGVRKASASRAIRQLAEREILIPRRKSGTFVGPGFSKHKRSKVRVVYVLLPVGDPTATHWSFQLFTSGIRNEIPEANVQFTFIPDNDPLPYVREAIDGARQSGQFAGVVASSCPPEVYRYIVELQIPAVVYGGLYSSQLPIAAMDPDSYETGRLLARYLVNRGHRRIALAIIGAARAGNFGFLDGITEVLLSNAQSAPGGLLLRPAYNLEAMQAIVWELMRRPDRPTAIITRGSVVADAISSLVTGMGNHVPSDVEIVFDCDDRTLCGGAVASYAHAYPKPSFVEIAGMAGRILKEMRDGIPASPQRVVIPVEMYEPEWARKPIADPVS
jgi:DNA-binding LacI/PurR family transcriptional regulator